MTNTLGEIAPEPRDEWAAAAEPDAVDAERAGLPVSRPKTGIPFEPIHATVAGLFALGAVLHTVWLFVGKLTSGGAANNFRYPQEDATFGLVIVFCLLVVVLVVSRRGREFGLALGLALASGLLLSQLHELTLSLYVGSQAVPYSYLYGIGKLCLVAGGLAAGIEWRWRSLATPTAPKARRNLRKVRRQRLLCLLVGAFGVLPIVIGTALTTVTISLPSLNESFSCCAFSGRATSMKADYLGLVVFLVAFVMFAAIERSLTRSVAWLVGAAMFGLSASAALVTEAIWPEQSTYGIGAAVTNQVQVTLTAGSWLTLVGTLVLTAAAAARAGLDRSAADPYAATMLTTGA